MTRLLFLLLFFPALQGTLWAQDTSQKLQIGPTIGLNAATTSISQVIYTTNKYGYNIGAKAKYPLGKRLALNGLLVYTQKGAVSEDAEWHEEYNYLELPIFLSYEFGSEATKFYPIVGIQQGYLLGAKVITGGGSTPFYPTSEVYRYELGASAGVGSQLRISPKAVVFLDLRCAFGLTDIWKSEAGIFSQREGIFPDYYNTVVSLNTGVLF